MSRTTFLLAGVSAILLSAAAAADTLELADGTIIRNCYVRDEGVQITVWERIADVGRPPKVYPRSAVKGWKVARGAEWDRKVGLPDLSVTYIEINPKLAGLHGCVQYDKFGRPWIEGGSELLIDMDARKFIDPEGAVKNLKLKYEPGEELTLTAHIKNLGFKSAKPFKINWLIDDQLVSSSPYPRSLAEMEEASFDFKWRWQDGFHSVTVQIVTSEHEIAKINNTATDALWAFPFFYVVNKGRVAAWHDFRSAYGTFSFEDFYRWHLDIMNLLFEHSIYPAAPKGIHARVRLDRIIYADKVVDNIPYLSGKPVSLAAADGIRYDQGGWIWTDQPQERERGEWIQIDTTWRNQTEWSLPHELGHQLGLVDWYALDYPGVDYHAWPDNGVNVTHFMRYPYQMMHWHGPQPFGEADAAYLNYTIDKPRGYFGDYYFANPEDVFLAVVDINGQPVPGAKIEIFQRGASIDPEGTPIERRGVRYFPVIEDGDFYRTVKQIDPASKQEKDVLMMSRNPVVVGQTDDVGVMHLPNRPAEEVRTLNGFHRRDNPFGNMNVVGPRNLMLVKVTKDDRVAYFWIEGHDLVVAWFRGHRHRYVMTLNTPFGSIDSPPPPSDVRVEKPDEHHATVTWTPPVEARERNYLDTVIGYKVYRRIGNDGLDDRPWFPVATLAPDKREFTVDLREYPQDTYWYPPRTQRFGVTTLAATSKESELTETLLE